MEAIRAFFQDIRYTLSKLTWFAITFYLVYSGFKGFALQYDSARESTCEILRLIHDAPEEECGRIRQDYGAMSESAWDIVNAAFIAVSLLVFLFTFTSTAGFSLSNQQRDEPIRQIPDAEEIARRYGLHAEEEDEGILIDIQEKNFLRRALSIFNRSIIFTCALIKTLGAGISVFALWQSATLLPNVGRLAVGGTFGAIYLPFGMLSEVPRLNYRNKNLGTVVAEFLGENPSYWQKIKLGVLGFVAFAIAYEFGRYDILLNWVKILKMPVYIDPEKYDILGQGEDTTDSVWRWTSMGLTLFLALWNGMPAFHKLLPPILNVSNRSPMQCLRNVGVGFFNSVTNPKDILVFLASALKTFNVIVSAWVVTKVLFDDDSWASAILQGMCYFAAQLVFNAHTTQRPAEQVIDVEAVARDSDEGEGIYLLDQTPPAAYHALRIQH